MRTLGAFAGAVALTFGLVVGTGSAAGAARSPFTGHWTSVDIVDGSSQRMSISGGPAPRVRLHDEGATVCNPDLSIAARVRGAGSVSGSTLSVGFDVTCLTRPPTLILTGVPFTFDHDPGTGTLTDSDGTVWSRSGS
ncbi:MAG: hypothetical protein ACR2O6_03970 [Ilumatobacteraceae bacterium]